MNHFLFYLKYNAAKCCALTILVIAVLAVPSGSFAHSLFIQSSRYHMHTGQRSPLFFCYGHYIPVADGIRGRKLNSVKVFSPDASVKEISVRDETSLHSYMVDYETPGTYVLTAETTPGYYTVFLDKKGKKRHAIKPKSAIMNRAQQIQKSYYSKQYTKTYVVCEKSSDPFPAQVGLPLELVPSRDLASLKPGDNLELKVYLDGEPYAAEGSWDATYSGFSTESEDFFYPKSVVTGEALSIPIPNSGRWFIRYAIKKDATGADSEHYNQMKLTATLVFQIPNERIRPKATSR